MPNISASSYATWQTCHRLYYYEQILRLRRAREDGARGFGTMYHSGLEAWWGTAGDDSPWKDPDAPLVAAFGAIAEKAKHIATDRFDVARAEAMMTAYHARWFELRFENGAEGDGEETWYDVPLRDSDGVEIPNWRVVGKRDAIKTFEHERMIVEHKHTSQEIHLGSDYWVRLALDMQATMYLDGAQQAGHKEIQKLLYDVSRKPRITPELATPEEKRKLTKGKGCTTCGGRAGGKNGPAKGTGLIRVPTPEGSTYAGESIEQHCPDCKNTGWREPPALYANQRDVDESVDDYRARVREELAEMPDAYFRQGTLTRSPEQIAEARENLVTASGEIESMTRIAQTRTLDGSVHGIKARSCFTMNTSTCMNIYGRRCDFLPVCTREILNPYESPLYQLKTSSRGGSQ